MWNCCPVDILSSFAFGGSFEDGFSITWVTESLFSIVSTFLVDFTSKSLSEDVLLFIDVSFSEDCFLFLGVCFSATTFCVEN